jgi:DSBA-like thioredoxin domain
MAVEITLFTDPACPFAFSAEPARIRLRWHYGDGLEWTLRMIVLTLEPGESEKLAEGAPGLQRRFGMPIDPAPYPRTFSSEPACRAVVAARLHAPGAASLLLRALRVRAMTGGLLDDPGLIAGAAGDAGLQATELDRWMQGPETSAAVERDIEAARHRRPPRGRSITSSVARLVSAATRPPATSCADPAGAPARACPALIRSRLTRPRSPASTPSWSADGNQSASSSCLSRRLCRSRPPRS